MSWTAAFKQTLDAPSCTVAYSLRFFRLPVTSITQTSRQLTEVGRLAITEAEIQIQGVSVIPQNWGVTFGGFTIELSGDLRPISSGALRKGNVASLYMSRNNQQPERVCIGQLRSISGVRGIWTLEFVDILTMLYARVSNMLDRSQYYHNAGQQTTVSSSFNIGVSPNLFVADVSKFEKDSAEHGIIKITSGGVTDFWTYSSIGANYLVIATTGNYPGTGTLTTASASDVVVNCARTKGRPDHILHRTLMSINGDGTEGTYDTYPSSYNVNVRWGAEVWDVADANFWYQNVLKIGATDLKLDIIHQEPATEGIRGLTDNLALLGIWPVWRQNQMSLRSVEEFSGAPNIAIRITDRDIIEILNHDIYSLNQQVVYAKHTYEYRNASAGVIHPQDQATTETLPVGLNITRDVSSIVERTSSAAVIVGDALRRTKQFDFNTYEELTLQVTERAAILCAGDIIMVTSSLIYGFSEAIGKTYRGRKAMVMGTIWRPKARHVILTLAVGIE